MYIRDWTCSQTSGSQLPWVDDVILIIQGWRKVCLSGLLTHQRMRANPPFEWDGLIKGLLLEWTLANIVWFLSLGWRLFATGSNQKTARSKLLIGGLDCQNQLFKDNDAGLWVLILARPKLAYLLERICFQNHTDMFYCPLTKSNFEWGISGSECRVTHSILPWASHEKICLPSCLFRGWSHHLSQALFWRENTAFLHP